MDISDPVAAETPRAPLGETKTFKLNLQPIVEDRAKNQPNYLKPIGSARKQTPRSEADKNAAAGRPGQPLSHQQKKNSRQLRTELGQVIGTTKRIGSRVEAAQEVVTGMLNQLEAAAKNARERLEQNPKMVQRAHNGDAGQRPIVAALEKLAESSASSLAHIRQHEDYLAVQLSLVSETLTALNEHWAAREGALESASGGLAAAAGPALDDEVTHAVLAEAAAREDSARVASMKALEAARKAASVLQSKKSAVQLSVRQSRDNAVKVHRAQRTGNFGSTADRVTNPAARNARADLKGP